MPPVRPSQNRPDFRKSEIAVRPNPATQPYAASAVAAPRPVASPLPRPLFKERRMHSTPIGPTGAAIESPMTQPLKKNELFSILLFRRYGHENKQSNDHPSAVRKDWNH